MQKLVKHFTGIITVMITAIGVVTILAWEALKPINRNNGFTRKFIQNITLTLAAPKDKDITGICGVTDFRIYFTTSQMKRVLESDHSFKIHRAIDFNIPSNDRIISSLDYIIDSPNICIMAGNAPAVMLTTFDSSRLTVYNFPESIFTRSTMISSTKFAFRGLDPKSGAKDQFFLVGNLSNKSIIRENNISERKNDLGLSTDGLLHFDNKSNQLLYIFFYKNKFLTIDTNLNIIYQVNTIDTIQKSNSKTGSVSSKEVTTYTTLSPSRKINSRSHVADGYLYNNSRIKADNEKEIDFSDNSVIDVYDLVNNGAYVGSFYIPPYKNEKMLLFKVYNNQIIVVYKTYLAIYEIKK